MERTGDASNRWKWFFCCQPALNTSTWCRFDQSSDNGHAVTVTPVRMFPKLPHINYSLFINTLKLTLTVACCNYHSRMRWTFWLIVTIRHRLINRQWKFRIIATQIESAKTDVEIFSCCWLHNHKNNKRKFSFLNNFHTNKETRQSERNIKSLKNLRVRQQRRIVLQNAQWRVERWRRWERKDEYLKRKKWKWHHRHDKLKKFINPFLSHYSLSLLPVCLLVRAIVAVSSRTNSWID